MLKKNPYYRPRFIMVTDVEGYIACIKADAVLSAIRYKDAYGKLYTKLNYIDSGMSSGEILRVSDTPEEIWKKLNS